jgi:hypothetical protein
MLLNADPMVTFDFLFEAVVVVLDVFVVVAVEAIVESITFYKDTLSSS